MQMKYNNVLHDPISVITNETDKKEPDHLLTSYCLLDLLSLIQRGREARRKKNAEIERKPGHTRYRAVLGREKLEMGKS